MSDHICHDIKTTRPDSSKRLPSTFSLVPVFFYLALSVGAYLNINAYLGYRKAETDRDEWKQRQGQKEVATQDYIKDKAEIIKEKNKAEKLAQWIEGTRALQPISVALSRCLPPEVALGQMAMERSPEMPSQIILTMMISKGNVEEVAKIQKSISDQHYRAYNSQQNKSGDVLEYHTMLVWNDAQ